MTAINAIGSSQPSGDLSSTPMAFSLQSVSSRKTHGTSDVFNLPVRYSEPIVGNISVEPRIAGTGHLIVFSYSLPIVSFGAVTVEDTSGNTVGSATISSSGNEVLVKLAGIGDGLRVKVSVNNINGLHSSSAAVGFLVGDLDDSREVTSGDLSMVKALAGRRADVNTFKADFNLSGNVTAGDVATVKARDGRKIP